MKFKSSQKSFSNFTYIFQIFIHRYIPFFLSLLIVCGCALDKERKDSAVNQVLQNINGGPVVPREANKIVVPFFHNHTNEASISEKLTLNLRRLISMDGRLAVVSSNNKADLRLAGMIKLYQVQAVQYGDFHEPIRKRLRIIASVKLIDIKKKKEIFYDGGVQAFEVFSEVIPPITSEIQVRDRVIENLARRLSVKVINGWYTELMTPIEKGKF